MNLSIIEKVNQILHLSYEDMATIANTTRQSIVRWNDKIKNVSSDETEADIIGCEFYTFLLWLLELYEIIQSAKYDAYDRMFVYLLRLYCNNKKMFFEENTANNFLSNEQIKNFLINNTDLNTIMKKKDKNTARVFSRPFMLAGIGISLPLAMSASTIFGSIASSIVGIASLVVPVFPIIGGIVATTLAASGIAAAENKTAKSKEIEAITNMFSKDEIEDFKQIFLSTADMGVYSLMHLYKYFKIRNFCKNIENF